MTRKQVLVVDDESANRELIEALLDPLGWDSVLAEDGVSALEKLNPQIDVILLDIIMPGLDGFEVARQIREHPQCGDTPIIMVTSLTRREDRLRAVEVGANDFISKPIDRVELQTRIGSLLKMKEAQDAIKLHRAELEITVGKRTASLLESERRYKRLYQESKKREALYRSFVNASADAVVVYDIEGRVQHVSPSFTRMFGWSLEELEGRRVPYVPEDQREATMELVNRVLLGNTPISSLETQRHAKDGTMLDVSVSAARFNDHNGNASGIVTIIRDISAFKAIERARRRAVHHLSHELVTPLAVIKTSVRNLAGWQLTPEERETNFNRIQRNLRRLKDIQEIVQDMVAPQEYQPTTFHLASAFREIVEDLRVQSSHREVNLDLLVDDSGEVEIIDPRVFGLVLRGLVKNAIENTPDEGRIVLSCERTAEGMMLTVADQGIGVSPADREFIFNAFHHTQATEGYSTKNPFDFNAGGKGLELMRLKILSESGFFAISFRSRRCRCVAENGSICPGRISRCRQVRDAQECAASGGTTFSVRFFESPQPYKGLP
ncbi:MAG: response regulator [Desulfomonile tiedjei]|nr:response regulator [Desulfomonile tiedjei]